jgi:hypothetical protein
MLNHHSILTGHHNAIDSIIHWFASPRRILWLIPLQVVKATIIPLLWLILGIVVKHIFGLNREGLTPEASQKCLLRRYLNLLLLSKQVLQRAFFILGTHFEVVSVSSYPTYYV